MPYMEGLQLHAFRCPKHRPNYLCQSNTYHHYLRGAWAAACDWPDFQLSYFSKDHMQVGAVGGGRQPTCCLATCCLSSPQRSSSMCVPFL